MTKTLEEKKEELKTRASDPKSDTLGVVIIEAFKDGKLAVDYPDNPVIVLQMMGGALTTIADSINTKIIEANEKAAAEEVEAGRKKKEESRLIALN